MIRDPHSRFGRGLAVVAFAVALLGASAEGQQSMSGVELRAEAARLVDDLRARGERLRALREELDATGGVERRAIYRDELFREWKAYAERLDQLVANVTQQQSLGVDPGEQLVAAQEMAGRVASGLTTVATARAEDLARLEDERAGAPAEEKATLDREIRRQTLVLHDLVESLVNHASRMKKLGIDASEVETTTDLVLRERLSYLEGRLRYLDADGGDLRNQLKGALDEEKAALQKEMRALNTQVSFTAESLRGMLDLADRRGFDTSAGRALLINTTKEVSPGALDAKVAAGLVQQWLSEVRTWLRENGRTMIVSIVVAIGILVLFWVLSRLAARFVRMAVGSSKLQMTKLLQDFFVTTATRIVLVIGVLVAFSQFGLELAPLLAGLGIAGFIVGFALQDTLSNFASGLMILVYRPYDVGDAVEVTGVLGVVSEMSVVSTKIKTFDNQKLIVPNSKIWGNVIRNLTAEDTRRVDMVFSISYGDDIAKAERLLREEVEKHELVLKEPEPVIRVNALGESSVNFVVRPWVRTIDYWTVFWDLTKNVKLRFDQEGISIPFPQRNVYVHKVE